MDKIDKDGDGRVTEDELKNWVKLVSRRQVHVNSLVHVYRPSTTSHLIAKFNNII